MGNLADMLEAQSTVTIAVGSSAATLEAVVVVVGSALISRGVAWESGAASRHASETKGARRNIIVKGVERSGGLRVRR